MDKSTVGQFFATMFPDGVPNGKKVLIWTLPDKQSFWHGNADEAADEAFKQARDKGDVYIGVGLSDKSYGRKARALNTQITGLYGLWADIDYKDAAHSKTNLPSESEALQFIRGLEKPPTLIVHSGHGFQAWWAFQEPWTFDTTEQRDYAANIARHHIYKLRDQARKLGWDIDATIDLARVMRVPGTMNYKTQPVPTTIVESSSRRYYPKDFNGIFVPKQGELNSEPQDNGVTFTLDPNASPPFELWEALRENDERVIATWNRARKDFKDTSASTYDMALASFASNAEWTDQQIVDLLIAGRRKHGDDLKLREDYYTRTLKRARTTTIAKQTESELDSGDIEPGENCLAKVSQLFQEIEIVQLLKTVGDPPVYSLTVKYGNEESTVTLGDSNGVTSQTVFRNRVCNATNVILPLFKKEKWNQIATLLIKSTVNDDLGPESSPSMRADEWIEDYISSHRPSAEEDWEAAAKVKRPYYKDGCIHIFLGSLTNWLRIVQGEHIEASKLGRYMRMGKWERYQQNLHAKATDESQRTTVSVYRRWAGARAKAAGEVPNC